MSEVKVTRNHDEDRYEAHLDGELAGLLEYQLTRDLAVLTHTEVDEAFGGRGIGGALTQFALDDIEAEGKRRVMPLCPFVKAWIGRHPEYQRLVYGVASEEQDAED